MSIVERLATWDRYSEYVVRIKAGKLYDTKFERALIDGDSFTLNAAVYEHTPALAVNPAAVPGAGLTVAMVWSATAQQWAGSLSYVAASLDARSAVRIIVTLDNGSDVSRLCDATVRFTRADGR